MKSLLIVSLLALALGAVAVAAMLGRPAAPGPRADAAALPAPGPAAELLARVEALSRENRELRERVTELELRPAPESDRHREPAVARDSATSAELAELRAELAALRAELERPGTFAARPVEASPDFKETVASTLTQIRKQEQVDKVRSQMELRLERLDQTLPKIDEWLGLTRYQSNSMRSALLARYEREAELVRRWEAGEDPAVLGDVKAADREAHRREIAAFLTPAQLETYVARDGGGGKSDP